MSRAILRLPSMTLALTPAAVCQCFTLVSLCTSIADPNWIQVQNSSNPDSKLIYGVAFTINAYQNRTDTGPLGGLHGWGMWLLYSLAALSYCAVLFSSFSFLMDFLGASVNQSKLVTSLHVSTAVSCVSMLGVCVACMCVIEHNLQRGNPGSQPSRSLVLGESFFIQILGLLFSLAACAFAIKARPEPVRSCDYLSVGGDDSDTEPLIGRAEREE